MDKAQIGSYLRDYFPDRIKSIPIIAFNAGVGSLFLKGAANGSPRKKIGDTFLGSAKSNTLGFITKPIADGINAITSFDAFIDNTFDKYFPKPIPEPIPDPTMWEQVKEQVSKNPGTTAALATGIIALGGVGGAITYGLYAKQANKKKQDLNKENDEFTQQK